MHLQIAQFNVLNRILAVAALALILAEQGIAVTYKDRGSAEMTPGQQDKLNHILRAVLGRPPEQREAFAKQLCADDETLLTDVLQVLRSDGTSTDTIDQSTLPFQTSSYIPCFSPNHVLLNRFRIVRFLKQGGMGEVYEADDAETGRVALKTIRPEIAEDARILSLFRKEVQYARKVTGTNVCRIHEIFTLPASATHNATAFLTMEFLDGATLSDWMRNRPPLSIEELETIALQICRGLETVHEAGIVHRDLKTGNIMLAKRKRGTEAVLMDFGLARELPEGTAAASGKTMKSGVAGTAQYMAPEQFQGEPVTPATDIYSLGVVLYELAAGKPPFEGRTPLALAVERAKPLAPVSSLRQGVPHRWDSTIQRCLRYKPEERLQTAQEVAEALTSRSFRSLNTWKSLGRRRRVTLLVTVAAVILFVFAFGWYESKDRPVDGSPEAMTWYNQGTAALREGTYLKASKALQMAVDLDKNFALAHARLADAWNELDFESKAKDEMIKTSALEPSRRLSPLDRKYVDAVGHTLVREVSSALNDYQEIFNSLPREMKPAGYVDLGRAYEKAGDFNQAIASYSHAAELAPNDPAPFVHLGVLECRRKHTRDGEAAFDKAERLYNAAANLEGRAEIDFQRGLDANTRHRFDEARTHLEKSLQAARAIPSLQLEIRALTRLSVTEYLAHNAEKSIQLSDQAIALAQENGLDYWVLEARIRQCNAYISVRDYERAGPGLERALNMAQRSQWPRLIALAQFSLASVRQWQNKPDEAIALAKAALKYYQPMGFATESLDTLRIIVRAEQGRGDNAAAMKSCQELLAFAKKVDQPAGIMQAEASLGSVLLDMERYPEALDHFQKSLSVSRTLNSELEYHLLQCADALGLLGEYDEAEHVLAAIPAVSAALPTITPGIEKVESVMLLSQRRYAAAKQIAERALTRKSNPDPAYFQRALGEIASASGSYTAAIEWCRKSLAQAQSESDGGEIAAAQLALANAYLSSGDPVQSMSLAQTARAFFASSGQKESEYTSLLTLAKASNALKDFANSKSFAKQGLDILSAFEHNWSPQLLESYSDRSDVRSARSTLAHLAN